MSYFGGKNGAGVFQKIINRVPPHSVYIEPFLGGGAVMRLKRPAAVNIGCDLDTGAVRQMRRWSTDLVASLNLTRGDRALAVFDGAGLDLGSPNLAGAAASAELAGSGDDSRIAISSPLAGSGGFGSGSDRAHRRGRRGDPQFTFSKGDAFDLLGSYPFDGSEFVYCDPPYMHECRGESRYKFELTDERHTELLKLLKSLPCRVMISGYWTRLYSEALQSWTSVLYQTTNRGRSRVTEWLWFNYSEPIALHDYRYLGGNFRERERIKRKRLRWVSRLRSMPTLERRALLAAMAEAWDS